MFKSCNEKTSGTRKGTYRTGLGNPVFDAKRSDILVEEVAVAVIDELETQNISTNISRLPISTKQEVFDGKETIY